MLHLGSRNHQDVKAPEAPSAWRQSNGRRVCVLNDIMVKDVGATLVLNDTQKSQAVGCLRALAERVVHRVKEYHIWDRSVPLYMTASVNQLWVVHCAAVQTFRNHWTSWGTEWSDISIMIGWVSAVKKSVNRK